MRKYQALTMAALLAGLLLAGCAAALPDATSLSTSTVEPELQLVREPIQLLVLHTNDNWGETEPCG